ncbi:MAG: asparagine synthase-related protein [Armatimonadota bacterium]
MLRELGKGEAIKTASIGGFCPYWTVVDGGVLVADTAEEIIKAVSEDARVIDATAVLELLYSNYILGDRTLIRGIQRMPWHAELRGDGCLVRLPRIPHSENYAEPGEIASNLCALLEEELWDVCRSVKHIWVLLSGGLDSRIVAGVLKRIEPSLKSSISCVTWGLPKSRDVVYATRIASWYDWDLVHINYDAELLWSNILRAAVWGGAEVAGIHLHGSDWFRNASPDDLVIAASFGDGIGRGEYNSQHLLTIRPRYPENVYELVHSSLVKHCVLEARQDLQSAWVGEEHSPGWVRAELDMHENYIRRMICHAMDYIRQFCRLHQAFTSDKVVSYVWSLSPVCRNDDIYCCLLKDLDSRLYSLPWARTGVAFDGTIEYDSSLSKHYHCAGQWLRNELKERLEELVFSRDLFELGVLNAPAVWRLWKRWITEPDPENRRGELIVKIAGLELLRRAFNVRPCRKATPLMDRFVYIPKLGVKRITRMIRSVVGREG